MEGFYVLLGAKDKEELLNRAKEQSENAPSVYKKSVELYYIARYFVAVFEARNHAIPIQVWNEYRNAFDHFFRHLTMLGLTPEEQEEQKGTHKSNQLKAMESHITRAVLDILKLNCHRSDDWYSSKRTEYSNDVLVLVRDGDFLAETAKKYSESRNLFSQAKAYDYEFGINVATNKKIVKTYLDAVFSYEELRSMYENDFENIHNALMQYKGLIKYGENSAHKSSFFPNVKASLLASIVFAIITFTLGYLVNSYSSPEKGEINAEQENKSAPAVESADNIKPQDGVNEESFPEFKV